LKAKRIVLTGVVATSALLASAVPASASDFKADGISTQDASGSFRGVPVQVRVGIKGGKLFVEKINVDFGWAGRAGGRYGHAQVYNSVTGHIWNTPNVGVGSSGVPGRKSKTVNRSYPNGSKICAVWWSLINGKWVKNADESCLTVHN
jgi:hypothetical protein